MALALLLLGLWTSAVFAHPPACWLRFQAEDDGVVQAAWVSAFLVRKASNYWVKKNRFIKVNFFYPPIMLEVNVISARCAEDVGFFKQGAVVVVALSHRAFLLSVTGQAISTCAKSCSSALRLSPPSIDWMIWIYWRNQMVNICSLFKPWHCCNTLFQPIGQTRLYWHWFVCERANPRCSTHLSPWVGLDEGWFHQLGHCYLGCTATHTATTHQFLTANCHSFDLCLLYKTDFSDGVLPLIYLPKEQLSKCSNLAKSTKKSILKYICYS